MGSVNTVVRPSVYLDANILIYAVEDVAGLGAKVRPLFERIDRGELRGMTGELSPAEVLVKPPRDGAVTVRAAYEQLLDPAGPLRLLPIARPVLTRAAELRAALPPL